MDIFLLLLTSITTLLVGIVSVIYINLKYSWIKYDLISLFLFRHFNNYKRCVKKNIKIVDIFETKVKKHPKKTFLIYQDEEYSYESSLGEINKVAYFGQKIGLNSGDIVAVMIHNGPSFIWTLFGLSRLGVQVSFINTNLKAKTLSHCAKASGAKVLIVGEVESLHEAVDEIKDELKEEGIKVYSWGNKNTLPKDFQSVQEIIKSAPKDFKPPYKHKDSEMKDPFCFVFTSGTTGLPKPAVITHKRALRVIWTMRVCGVDHNDIVYVPLPLYHSSGCLLGLNGVIELGATLVLRPKFSASNFWKDCVKHDVTVIMYIGEMCRFLCNTAPSEHDRKHKVHTAIGNGLRRDIWETFRRRFRLPNICEFYGSTEGNSAALNVFNKTGAVGRISPLSRRVNPSYLVRYDSELVTPIRDEKGFCIPVEPGDAGLLIGRITNDSEFDGYKGDSSKTNNKILKDVFAKGDAFFNTGDVLGLDKDYFCYFVDRLGDTYRWKGENVSTVEVSNVLSGMQWIEDTIAYGVTVSGEEGRAGMALIRPVPDMEITDILMEEFFRYCTDMMPVFAIPRFLRVTATDFEMTETLKPKKKNLVEEGFDPAKVGKDQLFYVNWKEGTFSKLNDDVFELIQKGGVRL